jgi:hypothetical protein
MKLINENIEHKFTRGGEDKLTSIGVGKIDLIKKWLEEKRVSGYNINDDLTINVNGDVNLFNRHLSNFPDYIQFNEVGGDFNIAINDFTSLRGCPLYVGEDFVCSMNKLNSLEYSPIIVEKRYFCARNSLTSLDGSPKSVGSTFNCSRNNLKSFETLNTIVGGNLVCYKNLYDWDEIKNLMNRKIIKGDIVEYES